MIYDYHCVDCGRKMKGEEISFDIAELIGIRTKENERDIPQTLTLISAEELKALSKKCGTNLQHGVRTKLEITLKDFLKIIADNMKVAVDKSVITDCIYDQSEMLDAFKRIWPNAETDANVNGQIEAMISAIWSVFYVMPDKDDSSENTEDYVASCYIEPEFFADGASDKLYSLSYAINDTVHLNKLSHPGLIRGYCPSCGAYVYDGAGKYEHIMIGLLGVQSSGKTSVIVAMIQELMESYGEFGIRYPGNVLCDSKWKITQDMLTLYSNGYPPVKTDAEININTFNASFLLTSENGERKKIFTFVDIAGEQCYDAAKRTLNPGASQFYPLITGCSIYLLCTCISQKGYVKKTKEEVELPDNAVMEVAKGIYANLDDKKEVPPLCILVTKSDMAEMQQSVANANPFDEIKVPEHFFHKNAFEMLKTTFSNSGDAMIRQPLNWCCNVYREMQRTTYLTMMSCSAMGRQGSECEYYPNNMENIKPAEKDGKILPVKRDNMDLLWQWLLQVAGMVETRPANIVLKHIPSYNESYDCRNNFVSAKHRQVFQINEFEGRLAAVQNLFLNRSQGDIDLEAAYIDDLTFFEKLLRKTKEKKMADVVESWG